MPRPKRGGGGSRRGGKGKDDSYRSDHIDKSDMKNERLSAYYKAQGIIPDEEWDSFMETLKQPLPTTFRVAGSRQTAHVLNETIRETHVPSLSDTFFEGEAVPPPAQIPWYPEGLAWQFNVSKKVLRKSPEFKKFHSFLVFETEVGNVSRQEAVSMLPPLFLDVEPHHRVLDMCAAPGSKTAQLLEALHAHDTVTASSFPSGLLIANDSDHKRTHLLIHQSARLPSPALMVTNLDASIFPIIKIPSDKPLPSVKRSLAKFQEQLLFDRILCDVPCSGDGTIRKNIGIWRHWQPMDGNGLHGLQLRILQRAIRMLKEDGRIVYSTCSMNPVENEAVIAAALRSNPGFELVDVSTKLPELIRRPGLTTWKPTVDKSITTSFASYEDFIQSLPESARADVKLTETHWPPTNAECLGLTHCLRIYPHLQNTGGFFVAVLQRRKHSTPGTTPVVERTELKREADEPIEDLENKKPRLVDQEVSNTDYSQLENGKFEADANMTGNSDAVAAGSPSEVTTEIPPTKAPQTLPNKAKEKTKSTDTGGAFKENPYTFLSPDDPTLQTCIERLHLTGDFPSSNVLVRNPEGDAVRSLYLTNDIVKSIVKYNDYVRIRLMTCGTKVLGKQEAGKGKEGKGATDAQFRILGEGLPVVLPYIQPEVIMTGDMASLKTLMEAYYPLCAGFTEPFRAAVESRSSGSHVVRFPAGLGDGSTLTHDLVLPLWKSNVSITLMIDKKAKSALSLRLFGEDITTAGRDSREAAEQKKVAAAAVTQGPEDLDDSIINDL